MAESATSPSATGVGTKRSSTTPERSRAGGAPHDRALRAPRGGRNPIADAQAAVEALLASPVPETHLSKWQHRGAALRVALQLVVAILEDVPKAVDAAAVNAADRAARYAAHDAVVAERARQRDLQRWAPHELTSAAQMGFANPADWRTFIDSAAPRTPAAALREWRIKHGAVELEGWTPEVEDARIAELKRR